MADDRASYEKSFSEWLARQVSPAQLSAIYFVFTDISEFCLSRKILKKPLFETDDLATLADVRETVEHSKVFAFSYRKQKIIMIAAIRHYCRFIKETKDSSRLIESEQVSDDKPESAEQNITANNSLLDFLIANNISFIDNRPKNGCLWIIGGKELQIFADKCSARGVTFHFKADGARATEYSSAWWTTDDFNGPAKGESAVPVADNITEGKPSLAIQSEKSNRMKFIEWLNKRGISYGAIFVALSSLERCTERVKAGKIIDDDIYHVISAETMAAIRSFLLADKDFINADCRKGNQLTKALNLYSEFFDEQLRPAILEVIAAPEPEMDSSDEVTTPPPSEIEVLLSEEIFAPLKLALEKENIRTIEDLRALKLWAFMNKNNLYSISMRQTVLAKVRRLLEPEMAGNPELFYEHHCGLAVYSEDTIAEQNEIETPVSTSALDEPDQSELAINGTNEQRLNLDELCSLAYTKPTGFSYKGKVISCASWSELYFKLVRELYSDYKSLFQHNMRFAGSSSIDFGSRAGMRRPKEIKSNIYLECNISATGFVSKIRWLFTYCSVNINDVIITYRRQINGNSRQTSQAPTRTTCAASECSVSAQESKTVDPEQIEKVEKIVLDADTNGVTCDGLYNILGLTMTATKTLVQKCKRVVEIKGTLYHEEAFADWNDGAKRICRIMEKLMQINNGYISAAQLYNYARAEMNMFLNDNDLNDECSVYEIAQHLFEKNSFGGNHYSFSGKAYISKPEDPISSNFDVICKFADDQGGVFREDDLAEHLTGRGIRAGNLRNQMRLGKEPEFFFYEPGTIISAKSMGIDDSWKESVRQALNKLFSVEDDHIVLRQIQPVWYETLPALPGHRGWTPLLLQYVLQFYGQELGAKTIMKLKSQPLDTLHAMLVKLNSLIQNFGDAVIAYLMESEIKQRSFKAEELRQLLVESGMIKGNELIWNMPKALADDERFAWDAQDENVKVRVG